MYRSVPVTMGPSGRIPHLRAHPADGSAVSLTHPSPPATRHRVRRALAVATDLGLVLALPTAAALLTVQRFRLADPATDGTRVVQAEATRLAELGDAFHRTVAVGGWLYALDGRTVLSMALALIVAAVLTGRVFPRLAGGRTVGRFLFRLPAGVDDHRPPAGWDDRPDADDIDPAAAVAPVIAPIPVPAGASDAKADVDRSPTPPHAEDHGDADPFAALAEALIELRGPDRPEPPAGRTDDDRAELDLGADATDPGHRWLGDEDDYRRWDREPSARPRQEATAAATSTRYENLVFAESSLSDRPLKKVGALTPTDAAGDQPIWSENHRAWLYHDHRTDLWFRHETGSGRWLPIDLCGS
jgi:hypothetical protein